MPQHPILYSFRRCPYAMRARLALAYSGTQVELREVVLRDKPAELLRISPKATVPVLQLRQQTLDESLPIMQWAIAQHDPNDWGASQCTAALQRQVWALIEKCDTHFKPLLDRYKYFQRYPGHSQADYRHQAEGFIVMLEAQLRDELHLFGQSPNIADMAILPFIRQFAHVDRDWFFAAPYPGTQRWLTHHLQSPLFSSIMKKYPAWQPSAPACFFPTLLTPQQ